MNNTDDKAKEQGRSSAGAKKRAIIERPKQQVKVVDKLEPDELTPSKTPRSRAVRKFWWLFFGLPMLLMGLYLTLFAADRYVTESKLFVTNVSPAEVGDATMGNLLNGGSRSAEYLLYVKEYILSLDMLLKLDQSLDLRSDFGAAGRDFWYRLSKEATQETFLTYYRSRVEVLLDSNSSVLTVITEGFSPEVSEYLNQEILVESEKFINQLSQQMANELLNFAKNAAKHSRTEVKAARSSLLALQNRYGVLDPIAQATAASAVISGLEAKNVELQAELRQLRTHLGENTSQVEMIKSTIGSLEVQINLERAKLAGTSGDKMNDILIQYLDAKAQVDFSADTYRLSLTLLERARAEAIRRLQSIVVIVKPQTPDEPARPQKMKILGTLILVLLLLYGLIKLVWAVVEDHRDGA